MNHKNSNFSEGSIEARKAQKNVFQAPKENNHQPGWADPAKLSFLQENKGTQVGKAEVKLAV